MSASNFSTSLRVALFGATGVAGAAVLKECLENPRIVEIISITRRKVAFDSPKLQQYICHDFLNLSSFASELSGLDACFYCLGVSQSQVKDPMVYRKITYDYTMEAANLLLRVSPKHIFHFLSGQGTDPSGRSRMMWARIKGETERALQALGLAGTVCWRPGYIHAEQKAKNRQFAERIARKIYPILRLFPSLTIPAASFAKAMLQATFDNKREGVIENKEIHELAEAYNSIQSESNPSQTIPVQQ